MDPTKFMIIAKGEICTNNVRYCKKNLSTHKYDLTFNNGSCYSYAMGNVVFMSNPKVLQPQDYVIGTPEGKRFYGVKQIYEFDNKGVKYWHLTLSGFGLDYKKTDLIISENCLTDVKSANAFDYLKEISELSELLNEHREIILKKIYEKMEFIPDDAALSIYLNPQKEAGKKNVKELIFPFGCNQSQYQAVKKALENQISVIQGPPGTGKTQTILNIIANLLILGKSVIVVSNNNSATQNVLEKLSKEEYGMDFLVALLGSAENKNAFISGQTGAYPNLSTWVETNTDKVNLDEITNIAEKLQHIYQLREDIARLKEKIYEIKLESKHFGLFASDMVYNDAIKIRRRLKSDKILRLWQEIQYRIDQSQKLSLWFKLKNLFLYGITDWTFYKQDYLAMIVVLQRKYYKQILRETRAQLKANERELSQSHGNYEKLLEEKSLLYLRRFIEKRYHWRAARQVFSLEDLYKDSQSVLDEYPIILSTTFCARTSLNADNVMYDYVIMDEASQVDVATGALALSCAKNAVIVGDLKQLPNVIKPDVCQRAEYIKTKYHIDEAYDFAHKSFLKSLVDVIPDVPSTLLKEHYRCHPRIISFCNQKFYNNELIVMTEDDNNGDALMAIKTVEGNHARGHYNQRQIDVIKEEILPFLDVPGDKIGIIAPYNEQVNEIRRQIPEIEAATVHKFQGREKEIIILSTVDNKIKDFTDNPYLLNVAVSRAKKRLIVVVSGNKQFDKGNIVDLISYIQYNKMEVIDSQIYSVFDYLYSQYREQRWKYLRDKKKVSQYDSENLTYHLLLDTLEDYPEYGVSCFVPLSMVIRDLSKLSEDEVKYALNPATHLDFVIFNKLSKQPIAAIETDGYVYHKQGTVQHMRDLMKDHILELSGLKLVRLRTTGSNEKEMVMNALGLE
ncbi:MAG: AAA family ATPase [Lachnospiraceae bacterium]|nr:AAA family ATPase [Lachnospiraceae bacterium]